MPHKLLIYQKGSKFEPHRDSEKSSGHIATLVVSLHSNHQGGSVHVSHAGQKKVFNTESASYNRFQWLAWYNDVLHEVKPLTFGTRMVLTYNILLIKPIRHVIFNNSELTSMKEELMHTFQQWSGKPQMLWYLLEHEYSHRSLSEKLLKCNDAIRLRALEAVCSALNFTLLFAQIEKSPSMRAKYSTLSYGL
ncbi:hypothetical protein EJ04DRAFT_441419 [Polyplosphaeria fusca]|uniref:Prolyl 4-hydroxylase alpha subunit Fe(2+) 2OG dioxygenase domain-containing protein n=1 Tax=Polyplosphaeria fusca TaxID=682080 RepID=A0A9P4QVB4_9PLEO|nr:hypothetical protein EJ04DRAFT_441419 [Polyplosphaeria fusca]